MSDYYLFLYTDGSILNNGRPDAIAASAAILVAKDSVGNIAKTVELVDKVPGKQTNNRAELWAVIIGLRQFTRPAMVVVTTDSEYVFYGGQGVNKRKTNHDLWEALDYELLRHDVSWRWTKGHQKETESDPDYVKYNRRADELAGQQMRALHAMREIKRGILE
jgi:ribonuclease HI